ncbi:MAG: hypothetical protein FWH54_06470 [Methanobrevibacter sp.]|nr:hypothetical protein [Methanobrevibacter sp.]
MKNLKIILIICVIAIGATDIILYNWDINLFPLDDNGNSAISMDNQELFAANLKNASNFEKICYENLNNGVISKINRNIQSPTKLKENLSEIKSSLATASDANENSLKYLNECKKYTTNDIEKQYIDLLIQKANIDKKVLDSYLNMMSEYEKFANKKLDSHELSVKMSNAKDDLIKNHAIDQDKTAIDLKIATLLKNNPDLKTKLEKMDLNPSFFGKNY